MSRNKSAFNFLAKNCGLDFNEIQLNDFHTLFLKYFAIAINRYRWTNLPPGIESRHIEKALCEHGQVFFYEKKNIGFVCLPCNPINSPNFNNDPLAVQVTAVGWTEQKRIENGVRILNDDLAIPTSMYLRYYIDKICNVEKTINKNLIQQRNPTIFSTTKDKEYSVKAVQRKIENDEIAVFVDGDIVGGDGSLILHDVWKDFRGLDYNTLKQEYEKELLEHLGINTTLNKLSGMATDEVNSNNVKIEMLSDLGYKTRILGRDFINEKFNLNVDVEKVTQTFKPLFDTTLSKKGGGSNE